VIHIDAADLRFVKKMEARVARALGLDRPHEQKREHEDDTILCVEGLAIVFEDPIATKTGDILVFEKSAFDDCLAKAPVTEFWLSHDKTQVVGSTNSGLEIAKTEDGLVFRMPLTNRRFASKIERMVNSETQSAISIGVTRIKERTERVGNHRVIFIEKAKIDEVSLVKAGACEVAFARLVDAKYSPSLKDSAKSKPFAIERGMHDLKVQHSKVADRLDVIARKLSALEQKKAVEKTESKVDAWYEKWNRSFDAESPAITKWAKSRNAAT
jgi:HK97 family phage prohead protease